MNSFRIIPWVLKEKGTVHAFSGPQGYINNPGSEEKRERSLLHTVFRWPTQSNGSPSSGDGWRRHVARLVATLTSTCDARRLVGQLSLCRRGSTPNIEKLHLASFVLGFHRGPNVRVTFCSQKRIQREVTRCMRHDPQNGAADD